MELNYIIIALSVCLILSIAYILYSKFKDRFIFQSEEEDKRVRFNDKLDAMSFLDPNYEQKRRLEIQNELN